MPPDDEQFSAYQAVNFKQNVNGQYGGDQLDLFMNSYNPPQYSDSVPPSLSDLTTSLGLNEGHAEEYIGQVQQPQY